MVERKAHQGALRFFANANNSNCSLRNLNANNSLRNANHYNAGLTKVHSFMNNLGGLTQER